MKYEIRRPNSEAEATEIIDGCLRVIYGQIEVYRGVKRKAWSGDFVDHCRDEAIHSLAWLADRHPKLLDNHSDERCLTCGRTDAEYRNCDWTCVDPWHADSHLRRKNRLSPLHEMRGHNDQ